MDPSAPPKEWPDEKSSMAQAPPPPYQDNQNLGYPQPGPGYPQPGPGFYSRAQESVYPPPYGGQQQYTAGQQYPPQAGMVTIQPTVLVTRAPLETPVNDYMCYSIFTMLCCCLPLGIAALIYSINNTSGFGGPFSLWAGSFATSCGSGGLTVAGEEWVDEDGVFVAAQREAHRGARPGHLLWPPRGGPGSFLLGPVLARSFCHDPSERRPEKLTTVGIS
ncbi:uncharacterized protein LOC133500457 isoform X1 [Syngnathoides biaculeatus]|uniref:uncharacterized protein LOC133500457 isoform X1 n=1 Tax=Syngnathoides biaculeatus TaxID=300417 RepID=UPI002ADE6E42|nr:uncharacterized protein LOC133500457 isoform X1 [Syngnathoides biaculeatus]